MEFEFISRLGTALRGFKYGFDASRGVSLSGRIDVGLATSMHALDDAASAEAWAERCAASAAEIEARCARRGFWFPGE